MRLAFDQLVARLVCCWPADRQAWPRRPRRPARRGWSRCGASRSDILLQLHRAALARRRRSGSRRAVHQVALGPREPALALLDVDGHDRPRRVLRSARCIDVWIQRSRVRRATDPLRQSVSLAWISPMISLDQVAQRQAYSGASGRSKSQDRGRSGSCAPWPRGPALDALRQADLLGRGTSSERPACARSAAGSTAFSSAARWCRAARWWRCSADPGHSRTGRRTRRRIVRSPRARPRLDWIRPPCFPLARGVCRTVPAFCYAVGVVAPSTIGITCARMGHAGGTCGGTCGNLSEQLGEQRRTLGVALEARRDHSRARRGRGSSLRWLLSSGWRRSRDRRMSSSAYQALLLESVQQAGHAEGGEQLYAFRRVDARRPSGAGQAGQGLVVVDGQPMGQLLWLRRSAVWPRGCDAGRPMARGRTATVS